MHEFHSVKLFIDEVVKNITPGKKVRAIHVLRNVTFVEEAARLAFNVHSKGTPLEQADVVIEPLKSVASCSCGFKGEVIAEGDGSPVLCPSCQNLIHVDPGAELELAQIIYDVRPR
ncbi:MAG: hydrogenase/urease maturation nickel metallochaperone HypA [Elusimicrobiota bacterium]|jgi:Zn finger protein HypA/HybF involved in hydrogenase expression